MAKLDLQFIVIVFRPRRFVVLSSWLKISSTNLSWYLSTSSARCMASAFWQSAEQSRVRLFWNNVRNFGTILLTAILTSSLDNCWSLSRSICLNTLTAAGPSLVSNNSISWCRVAPPGRRGTINLLFSPPYSHPSLIWPTPIWNSNGSFLQIIAFLSKEDSNLVPSSKVLVKCIVTCWPNLALFSQVSGISKYSTTKPDGFISASARTKPTAKQNKNDKEFIFLEKKLEITNLGNLCVSCSIFCLKRKYSGLSFFQSERGRLSQHSSLSVYTYSASDCVCRVCISVVDKSSTECSA